MRPTRRARISSITHMQFRTHTGMMYPEPTLPERVAANLKVLGLRPVAPEAGAAHLNAAGLPDANGHAWTATTLAAFMDAHDIRPERVPDLSHLKPWNEGRPWTDPERILRTIERGPDDEIDELRRLIKDDAAVRRAVIEICAVVNDNPYDPGLYERWLAFARREQHMGKAPVLGAGSHDCWMQGFRMAAHEPRGEFALPKVLVQDSARN